MKTVLQVWLDKDALIEMLNVAQPRFEVRQSSVLRYMKQSGNISREEAHSLWQAEVSSRLRHRVDEWLDTGLNPDGSESPLNRDLFRTDQAVWDVLEYLESNPPRITVSPLSLDHFVTIGEPRPLSDKWNDFFMDSVREADRYFTCLMESDWKESVCQCRYARCSRYFFLNKPRQCYRYGTFCCPKHQRDASAAICTRLQRVRAHKQLIEYAAAELVRRGIDGPDWRKADSWKRRLASALSLLISREQLHSYRQEVGVNWVNRQSASIELRRAQLWVRQTGATGKDGRAAARQPPRTRLKWVPKQTPDLRHFIRILSIQ